MDISTEITAIRDELHINPVRKAISDAIFHLSLGYIDIGAIDDIRTEVYGPNIRKAILRGLVDILNYRKISDSEVHQALYKIATLEYGRDLREPIIDILTKLSETVADIEITLGSGWTYGLTNCSFSLVDGSVTELDPGHGVGGSETIPNALESGMRVTVKSESTIGQDLEWCMMLYDSSGNYLHDETMSSGYSQWRPVNSTIVWNTSDSVGEFRVFIRDFTSGMDLSTLRSGLDEGEEQMALVQGFKEVVDSAD